MMNRVAVLKAKYIARHDDSLIGAAVNVGGQYLGIRLHRYESGALCIRLMLAWWHVFVRLGRDDVD